MHWGVVWTWGGWLAMGRVQQCHASCVRSLRGPFHSKPSRAGAETHEGDSEGAAEGLPGAGGAGFPDALGSAVRQGPDPAPAEEGKGLGGWVQWGCLGLFVVGVRVAMIVVRHWTVPKCKIQGVPKVHAFSQQPVQVKDEPKSEDEVGEV